MAEQEWPPQHPLSGEVASDASGRGKEHSLPATRVRTRPLPAPERPNIFFSGEVTSNASAPTSSLGIFPKNPSTVRKVSIGWVVEFKPIRSQTEDGKPRLALTWVITQADHQCHIVGSIGLTRTLKLIETGDSLL